MQKQTGGLPQKQNIVIEVDGKYHQEQEQMKYDQERTKELEATGIKVLRLTNEYVHNIDAALAKIKLFIGGLKVPSPLGEG
jgi:very-short-patch-repair endonuclease